MWLPILCERYGRAAHERRQRDDAVAVADAAPIQACARIRAVRYVSRLLTQRCSAGCKQCRDLVRHATTPYRAAAARSVGVLSAAPDRRVVPREVRVR